MKAQLKNYMSLTKKEWNGMLVLVVLIIVVLAAPYVYQWFSKDSTINPKEFNEAVAQMQNANPGGFDPNSNNAVSAVTNRNLFKFDPNTLATDKWKALGLTDKQINTIQHYRGKGGKFYKPTDLKRIYGIADADYRALAPYIQIPKGEYITKSVVIELNTADSAKLTSVAGIGPAFAKRIIYYRERLGGFISKEQLKEVFGFDDLKYGEVKKNFRVDASKVHKISINTVSFDKLRLMPYLNYKQVNAIIEYRKQHGNYTSMDDLTNIAIIDAGILRKIEPYLTFNDPAAN